MDLHFYHLKYDPFLSPPALESAFLSHSQGQALDSIQHGVNTRQGFVMLLGAGGLGKTTVLQIYLHSLDTQQYKVLPLSNPNASLKDLLAQLGDAFDLAHDSAALRAVTEPLHHSLQWELQQGRYVVITVDNAHELTVPTLWNLRMLSDLLRAPQGALVQVILVGRPELASRLRLPELQSLQARFPTPASLTPLTRTESLAYINHRLAAAATQANTVFTPRALARLGKSARGNPRALNTLCTEALFAGLLFRQHPITAATVREAIAEQAPGRSAPAVRVLLVGIMVLLFLIGLLGSWLYASRGQLFWTPPVPTIFPHTPGRGAADKTTVDIASTLTPPLPPGPVLTFPHRATEPVCLSPRPGKPCAPESLFALTPATASDIAPVALTVLPPMLPTAPLPPQPAAAGSESAPEFADETALSRTQVLCAMPRTDGRNGKDIIRMDYTGTNLQPLVADGALNLAPSLSPDGTTLAYTSYRNGMPNIYLRDLTTGRESRLTTGAGLALPGAWSPNGRYLALSQSNDGNSDIFLYDTVRQHLRRLTTHQGIDISPYFAPDNTRLVFTSDRSGSPQLYLTDVHGRPPVRLTYHGAYNTEPVWSPRNDTIAFIGRSAEGGLEVYTIQANGSGLQRLTRGRHLHKSLAWAPSGHFVLSHRQRGAILEQYLVRADGQDARVLPHAGRACQSPQWITAYTQ